MPVGSPGMHVLLAPVRFDERESAERCAQRRGNPFLLAVVHRCLVDSGQDLCDESPPPGEKVAPMTDVGLLQRTALIEQPEDSLGKDIAEFLVARPFFVAERVIGALDDASCDRKWLYSLDRIQEIEPILIIDLRKEGTVAAGFHSQRTTSDERILAAAYSPIGMTDDGIIRKATDGHADGVIDAEQVRRPAQIRGGWPADVVVHENNPPPADQMAEHQCQVPLQAGVGPADERSASHDA